MKSKFRSALDKLNKKNSEDKRTWIYVAYDQVTDRVGPLAKLKPEEAGIILIENPWKARRRPYHKQKLALILSNLRHFALEQAARGVAVRHEVTDGPYRDKLEELAKELGTITMMEAAEYELRQDVAPLVASGALNIVPNESWLTNLDDLKKIKSKDGKYRMDAFYRHMRQKTGILMEGGNSKNASKPIGGKYSFDTENRQPWKGLPPAPEPPTFAVDEITEEVAELIEKHFAHHPGTLDLPHLCSTQEDADTLWHWAVTNCLEHFGPYEDAMSFRSSGIFHTRISQPLNILRLIPKSIVIDVLKSDIDLPSKEGFIRQVIGWREYMHHMHELTDGYRTCTENILETPTDAGYKTWSGKEFKSKKEIEADKAKDGLDGGAAPSYLDSHEPLPAAYWGTTCGLNCLDTVVDTVWKEAYSHHITRLMVLSNIATLMDISPRELTDWFWIAYADAYDWVVEPNVLAMGTFALGDMMTTKPYVSGAAYINKMSDYCQGCRFDPAKNCPITRLYWAFLARKGTKLEGNQRLAMPLNSLKKRSPQDKEKDQMVYEKLLQILKDGKEAHPKDFI